MFYYMWRIYGIQIQMNILYVMEMIIFSRGVLLETSIFMLDLDKIHWGLVVLLTMVLVGWWSCLKVPKVVDNLGNSNYQPRSNKPHHQEEGCSINVARFELLEKMVCNLIPTIKSDEIDRHGLGLEKKMSDILNYIEIIHRDLHQMSTPQISTIYSQTMEELKDDIKEIKNWISKQMASDTDDNRRYDNIYELRENFDQSVGENTSIPYINVARGDDHKGKRIKRDTPNKSLSNNNSTTTTSVSVSPTTPKNIVFPPTTNNNNVTPTTIPLDVVTSNDIQKFIGRSRKEMLDELKEEERVAREAERAPEFLTEEEKECARTSLATLDRIWRKKAEFIIKNTDYIEIGTLDEDQLTLPRRYIKEIIQGRRTADFLKRMREEGKETFKCDKCGRSYLAGRTHNCFVTKWTTDTTKHGLPAEKRVVISQTGSGNIQITRRPQLNPQKLDQAYQKISQYKMVLDDRNNHLNAEEDPAMTVEVETSDVAADNSDNPAVINTAMMLGKHSTVSRDFCLGNGMYTPW